MGNRRDNGPLTNIPFVDDSVGWTKSSNNGLSDEAEDTIWTVLEKASINASKRKIIWPDGQSSRSTCQANAFTQPTNASRLS